MREITLQEAFNCLQACEGVILEDRLIAPVLLGLDGDPDNEFLHLSWTEEIRGEYLDFCTVFKEGDNQIVLSNGSVLTFINSEEQEEEITLLRPWNWESV